MSNLTLFASSSDEHSGAEFSADRVYRYRLWRIWEPQLGLVCWVLLNPSTADEFVLDPTCRRVDGFTRRWGYGGWYVVNLFGLRSTDPKALYGHTDPIGPDNDRLIVETAKRCKIVVAGWGAHGKLRGRSEQAIRLLRHAMDPFKDIQTFGGTKGGQPQHPLYLRSDATLKNLVSAL